MIKEVRLPADWECVPVIIPTLCRSDKLINCVTSLARNRLARFTDLYIGIDYPTSESHLDGYQKILEFCHGGIKGFRNVIVVEREENFGPGRNFRSLENDAFRSHDTCILTEDDNEFSPCFLEFMNKGLYEFADDDRVAAVCGYSRPVNWKEDGSSVLFMDAMLPAWGLGVWKDSELDLKRTMSAGFLQDVALDKDRTRFIREGSELDYSAMLVQVLRKQFGTSDTARSVFVRDQSKVYVCPKESLVRNCGWDGTGEHCRNSSGFDKYRFQQIDESESFEFVYDDELPVHPENRLATEDFCSDDVTHSNPLRDAYLELMRIASRHEITSHAFDSVTDELLKLRGLLKRSN